MAARDLRRQITALEANAPAKHQLQRAASPEALAMLERQADRLIANVPDDPNLWTFQDLAVVGEAANFWHRASALRAGVDPDAPCHRLTDDPQTTIGVARVLRSVAAG